MQDAKQTAALLTSELEAGIPSKELVDQRRKETHVLVDRLKEEEQEEMADKTVSQTQSKCTISADSQPQLEYSQPFAATICSPPRGIPAVHWPLRYLRRSIREHKGVSQ